MGKKKKPFIDKRNSTTYSLIFRETEDVDDAVERLLVPADAVPEAPDSTRPEAGPSGMATARALLSQMRGEEEEEGEGEEQGDGMAEERRKENILSGFPDDGYDYVKHLRTIGGRGRADLPLGSSAAEAAAPASDGPSVYLAAPRVQAPDADAKLVDARAAAVRFTAAPAELPEEVGAAGVIVDDRLHVQKQMQAELRELEAAMDEAEREGEGYEDFDSEGEGDLEDDFILGATAAAEGAEADEPRPLRPRGAAGRQSAAAALKAALAHRREAAPARQATGQLEVLEDRFSLLLGEYDADELGDLEDGLDAAQGDADLEQFADILDQFLAEQRRADLGLAAAAAGGQEEVSEDDDDEEEDEEEDEDEEEGSSAGGQQAAGGFGARCRAGLAWGCGPGGLHARWPPAAGRWTCRPMVRAGAASAAAAPHPPLPSTRRTSCRRRLLLACRPRLQQPQLPQLLPPLLHPPPSAARRRPPPAPAPCPAAAPLHRPGRPRGR
jgi:protein LTV1